MPAKSSEAQCYAKTPGFTKTEGEKGKWPAPYLVQLTSVILSRRCPSTGLCFAGKVHITNQPMYAYVVTGVLKKITTRTILTTDWYSFLQREPWLNYDHDQHGNHSGGLHDKHAVMDGSSNSNLGAQWWRNSWTLIAFLVLVALPLCPKTPTYTLKWCQEDQKRAADLYYKAKNVVLTCLFLRCFGSKLGFQNLMPKKLRWYPWCSGRIGDCRTPLSFDTKPMCIWNYQDLIRSIKSSIQHVIICYPVWWPCSTVIFWASTIWDCDFHVSDMVAGSVLALILWGGKEKSCNGRKGQRRKLYLDTQTAGDEWMQSHTKSYKEVLDRDKCMHICIDIHHIYMYNHVHTCEYIIYCIYIYIHHRTWHSQTWSLSWSIMHINPSWRVRVCVCVEQVQPQIGAWTG